MAVVTRETVAADAISVLEHCGERAWVIGEIIADEEQRVRVD